MENREFELLALRYMDMVFRLAFSYMKSASDADDVTQNVLLRLLRSTKPFESEEHARVLARARDDERMQAGTALAVAQGREH